MGRPWPDRRLGGTADRALQPKYYFRNLRVFPGTALYGGDYKPDVKLLPGSEAVVETVAGDKYAIGYSGIGTRPMAFAPSRWPPTTVLLAMTPPLRRPFPASTRSLGTSTCTSIRSRTSHRSGANRVHQIHPFQGRSGTNGKGRLLPDHQRDTRKRADQARNFDRALMGRLAPPHPGRAVIQSRRQN